MEQRYKELVCVLTFEEGFNSDTLSLKLNECLILEEVVITSNSNDGITDVQIYVYKYNDKFLIKLHGEDRIICRLIDNDLNLNIDLNNVSRKFEIDLSSGKYVGVKKSGISFNLQQSKIQSLYD